MNRVLVILLLFVGGLIGIVSLYTASLSGVMGKMGLVSGDFGPSIRHNELARRLVAENIQYDCGVIHVSSNIPSYLFAKGEKKMKLATKLGDERVICGVKYVQDGDVERGVYTIIKGLYYLKNAYITNRMIVEKNRDKCNEIPEPEYGRWVEPYLLSTDGRIHEVVLDIYKQVENARAKVDELCID